MIPWIIRPSPRPSARVQVFCFPNAGMGPSAFRLWAAAADPALEINCIQAPGREARLRESPFHSLEELVHAAAAPILAGIDRPFALFGHSIGALLAFEVARYLRRCHGLTPRRLFVSACPAPHLPWPHSPVRFLPEDQLLREVGRRYDGIPQAVLYDAEFRVLVARLLRADFSLIETYRHHQERPLDCPLSAFAGLQDETVPVPEIEAWSRHTRACFLLRQVDGHHFFLQSARLQLLQALQADLNE